MNHETLDEIEARATAECENCAGGTSTYFNKDYTCPECDGTGVPLSAIFNCKEILEIVELARLGLIGVECIDKSRRCTES